jgi:hypothetical protein
MPTKDRPAAWSNLNPRLFAAIVAVALLFLRIPFRLLLPLAAVVVLLGLALRPGPPRRPPRAPGV